MKPSSFRTFQLPQVSKNFLLLFCKRRKWVPTFLPASEPSPSLFIISIYSSFVNHILYHFNISQLFWYTEGACPAPPPEASTVYTADHSTAIPVRSPQIQPHTYFQGQPHSFLCGQILRAGTGHGNGGGRGTKESKCRDPSS